MRRFGISGTTLKFIAVFTMIVDHIGFGLIYRMIMAGGVSGVPDIFYSWKFYDICRILGRVAFPIYCFLLTEGFYHTKSRLKYLIRLVIFAFISEPCFDLCFASRVWHPGDQNVFFTLAIALAAISAMDIAKKRYFGIIPIYRIFLMCVIALLAMGAAYYMRTDYKYMGVLIIIVMYLLHERRGIQCIAGAVMFLTENHAPAGSLAFIPIYFYNGKRGVGLKYFFYTVYPAHLLLIYLTARYMGISQLSPL